MLLDDCSCRLARDREDSRCYQWGLTPWGDYSMPHTRRGRRRRGANSGCSLISYHKHWTVKVGGSRTIEPSRVHCSVHEILECVCKDKGEEELGCWNEDPVNKLGCKPLPLSVLRSCSDGIINSLLR